MSEWYRRKAVRTAWQGVVATLSFVVLIHFAGFESWGASLAAGCEVLGLAALTVAYWVCRGRYVARRTVV